MASLCSAPARPLRANLRNRGRRPARMVVVAAGARISGAEARASLVLALASQALATSPPRPSSTPSRPAASSPAPSRRPSCLCPISRRSHSASSSARRSTRLEKWSHTSLPKQRCLEHLDLISADHLSHSTCWHLIYWNSTSEQLEMTTPVTTRKEESSSEKMDMTTPVITTKSAGENKWKMSFVLPSKYGSNLPLPKDPSVTIKEVPIKIVTVAAFSGLVTDDDIRQRESRLRKSLQKDTEFRVRGDSVVEVAQYNPPFTLSFTRRNGIALEVERHDITF